MTFKIEKDIPVPSREIETKWPFPRMEIGDSVLFTEQINTARSMANRHGKLNNMKFTTRLTNKGLRIWRIA